jgi:hypothetical protein
MRIHVYPYRCAMRGSIQISTRRWGYVTIRPLTYSVGMWHPWGICVSPNATPWAATALYGPQHHKHEKRMARIRRALWGHGYDCERHNPQRAEAYLASIEGDLPHESIGWIFNALRALNYLRNPEGASVTILCDNPEAESTEMQAAIEVCDSWTNWEPRRFYGRDWACAVLDAHRAALAADALHATPGEGT